jgi:hypothetical protein
MPWVHEVSYSTSSTMYGPGGAIRHSRSVTYGNTPFGSYQRYSESFHDGFFERCRKRGRRTGQALKNFLLGGVIGVTLGKIFGRR